MHFTGASRKVGPDAGADGLRFPMMKKMDGPAGTPSESKEAYQPPDFVLVRIIDADVEPDVTYEYRMQIRMAESELGGANQKRKGRKTAKIRTDVAPDRCRYRDSAPGRISIPTRSQASDR